MARFIDDSIRSIKKYRAEYEEGFGDAIKDRRKQLPNTDFFWFAGGSSRLQPFRQAMSAYTGIDKYTRNHFFNSYHGTSGSFGDAREVITPYLLEKGILPNKDTDFSTVPGNGVTHLFAASVLGLLSEEDVVLVPLPTYGYHVKILEKLSRAGIAAFPRFVEEELDHSPEYLDQQIEQANARIAAATPSGETPKKVTVLLRINPDNPTGALEINQRVVDEKAQILQKHGIRLVIDDLVYMGSENGLWSSLKFLGAHETPISAAPMAESEGMFDKTISLIGLSKAYGMVSARSGLAIGPKQLIDQVKDIVQMTSEFVSPASQVALLRTFSEESKKRREIYEFSSKTMLINNLVYVLMAVGYKELFSHLEEDFSFLEHSKIKTEELEKFLDSDPERFAWARNVVDLKGIPGVKGVNMPQAGFFILLDFTEYKGKFFGKKEIQNDFDLMECLVREAGVYMLPARCFDTDDGKIQMRMTFSGSIPKIVMGMISMAHALSMVTEKPRELPEGRFVEWNNFIDGAEKELGDKSQGKWADKMGRSGKAGPPSQHF